MPDDRRPSVTARRAGYVIGALVNVAFWVAVHVWPGWQAAPFVTEDVQDVLPWVDGALGVSITVNVIWLVADPRWLRALGEATTSLVGLGATLRLLAVFPFAFDDDGVPWARFVRVVLVLAAIGGAIGVVTNLVSLVRAARRAAPPEA